mmetsp:Transcript_62972/g.150165  ORF Transcript_62972/g.150165 Transcript_62972/m.150165 type:complete len:201 (-) Transcript_62972:600-1202(-)
MERCRSDFDTRILSPRAWTARPPKFDRDRSKWWRWSALCIKCATATAASSDSAFSARLRTWIGTPGVCPSARHTATHPVSEMRLDARSRPISFGFCATILATASAPPQSSWFSPRSRYVRELFCARPSARAWHPVSVMALVASVRCFTRLFWASASARRGMSASMYPASARSRTSTPAEWVKSLARTAFLNRASCFVGRA